MPLVDREVVLVGTDLRALATEICGAPRGGAASARWHCPDPAHPDRHPSMGIYRSAAGWDRWQCHACGQGGTAIDLVAVAHGLPPGQVLRDLAARLGHRIATAPERPRPTQAGTPSPVAARGPVADPPRPHPAVRELADTAAALLWQPIGAGARAYLRRRGFTDEILAINRIGFDPGPRHLPRPRGLPFRGPAVVFPVLDQPSRLPCYYQLRYLNPARAGRKYDQPTTALAPRPDLAEIIPVGSTAPGLLVVAEGFPDALTATQTGMRAAAVLGVSDLDPSTIARALYERYPAHAFLICYDADTPARRPGHADRPDTGGLAADGLVEVLTHLGAAATRLAPAYPHNDLNDWWRRDPVTATRHLTAAAGLLAGPGPQPPPSADAAATAGPAISD